MTKVEAEVEMPHLDEVPFKQTLDNGAVVQRLTSTEAEQRINNGGVSTIRVVIKGRPVAAVPVEVFPPGNEA